MQPDICYFGFSLFRDGSIFAQDNQPVHNLLRSCCPTYFSHLHMDLSNRLYQIKDCYWTHTNRIFYYCSIDHISFQRRA